MDKRHSRYHPELDTERTQLRRNDIAMLIGVTCKNVRTARITEKERLSDKSRDAFISRYDLFVITFSAFKRLCEIHSCLL